MFFGEILDERELRPSGSAKDQGRYTPFTKG